MGGTPKGKEKPGPNYEAGHLRDPEIAEKQDADSNPVLLRSLIKRATRAGSATGGTPAA